MPSAHKRRRFLRLTASSTLVGFTGCLGAQPSDGSTTTAQPTTRAQTETETQTETTDPRPVETNTCDEQSIAQDVEIQNERSESVRVKVTIEDQTADSLLLDEVYDVAPGEVVEEEDFVFTSVAPETDHTIWATATVGAETADRDVTVVAHNAVNFTVVVRVTEESLTVFDRHFDPGEGFNFDCYPRN